MTLRNHLGDPAFNGKLYESINGKPTTLSALDTGNGYYRDTNGAWWVIQRELAPVTVNPGNVWHWRVALVVNYRNGNVPIYLASNGKPIAPGWSSGTSSSPQNAVDHIDAFAIRNRGKASAFPWWLLVVGYAMYKSRRR